MAGTASRVTVNALRREVANDNGAAARLVYLVVCGVDMYAAGVADIATDLLRLVELVPHRIPLDQLAADLRHAHPANGHPGPFDERPSPSLPTTEIPGSPGKVDILVARAERNESLWHEGDFIIDPIADLRLVTIPTPDTRKFFFVTGEVANETAAGLIDQHGQLRPWPRLTIPAKPAPTTVATIAERPQGSS